MFLSPDIFCCVPKLISEAKSIKAHFFLFCAAWSKGFLRSNEETQVHGVLRIDAEIPQVFIASFNTRQGNPIIFQTFKIYRTVVQNKISFVGYL